MRTPRRLETGWGVSFLGLFFVLAVIFGAFLAPLSLGWGLAFLWAFLAIVVWAFFLALWNAFFNQSDEEDDTIPITTVIGTIGQWLTLLALMWPVLVAMLLTAIGIGMLWGDPKAPTYSRSKTA